MTYREHLAGISGGVLGFIANNRKGAIEGYKYGKLAAKVTQQNNKDMAPTTRSKSKAKPRSVSRGRAKSRTSSSNRSRSMRSSTPKRKYPVTVRNETSGGAARAALVKNRVNKKVTFKKRKQVKVSAEFRKKVSKALSPKNSYGFFTEIQMQEHNIGSSYGNKQYAERLCPDTGAGGQCVFSPVDVLDAASILFNNKAPSVTKATASGNNTIFGSNSFDPHTIAVNVVNSTFSIVMRNNTKRTWIIQLYEMSPKTKQNILIEGDSLTQWVNVLQNEAAASASGLIPPMNVDAHTVNTMYASPVYNRTFKKDWNVEKHDIVLDPGQVYDHFMQGPADVVYDFKKFWKADSGGLADEFQNIMPGKTRMILFTARLDLVSNAAGNVGRWGIADANESLVVECTKKFSIQMPEEAGGRVATTTLGGIINYQNTQARDAYFLRNYSEGTATADTRIEEQTGTENV